MSTSADDFEPDLRHVLGPPYSCLCCPCRCERDGCHYSVPGAYTVAACACGDSCRCARQFVVCSLKSGDPETSECECDCDCSDARDAADAPPPASPDWVQRTVRHPPFACFCCPCRCRAGDCYCACHHSMRGFYTVPCALSCACAKPSGSRGSRVGERRSECGTRDCEQCALRRANGDGGHRVASDLACGSKRRRRQ